MKRILAAATNISLLVFACAVSAQEKGAVVVGQTEAVVTVVNLDRKARTATRCISAPFT